MITNTGKSIIGKYLVGQTTSYASYMAIGCGAKPVSKIAHVINNKALLSNTATLTTASSHGLSVGDYITVFDVDTRLNGTYQLISGTTGSTLKYTVSSSNTISSTAVSPTGSAVVSFSEKTSLDFEMLRIPIISKSFVTESGISKVILTAELPSSERYEISEIGLYPADINPAPTGLDSRSVHLFTTSEPWQYHTSTDTTSLPINLGAITNANNDITTLDEAFYINADNALFDSVLYPARIARYERPRFLNNIVMVRGNNSTLTASGGNLIYSAGSHIHLASNIGDLSKNSTNDELRLSFSVINKLGIGSTDVPSNVKILVQFITAEGGTPDYANFTVNLDNGTSTGQWDFANNRYVVVTKKLSELYKTANFAWTDVAFVRIFTCVNNNGVDADKFFVAYDAMRLENVSSFNSVYGLTAYTKLVTDDLQPIIKSENTSNFIEFKHSVDVL